MSSVGILLVHQPGEIVLCEQGHEVCDVIGKIHIGDVGYSEMVGNWRSNQIPAKKGDPVPLRCWCNAPYFNHHKFIMSIMK